MTFRGISVPATLVVLAMAVPAAAQYRTDAPAVLAPPPRPVTDVSGITRKFHDAYFAHGRPRIVVFWNRNFSAQVATGIDHFTTNQTQTRGKDVSLTDSARSDEGTTTLTKRESGTDTKNETHAGVRAMGENAAGAADSTDPTSVECEGAFMDVFESVPTRLIDRDTIMRTSAEGLAATETSNLQSIETKALMASADLILQMNAQPDPRSASGFLFNIEVRDLKTGEILAHFATQAVPLEAGQTAYVAAPGGGFQRVQTTRLTVGMLGRQLALETMERLSSAW